MKYYLIVGEASGDLHASHLMRSIMKYDAEAQFRFFGGDNMIAVGGTCVRHYKTIAYMGFIPVLTHLRTITKGMEQCKRDILEWQPDVIIPVDYAGFNLSICKFVQKQREKAENETDSLAKTRIFYYISPKIWAWKEYRIKAIRRDIDEMYSILPFEVEFYKKHDYQIHYVGNPCVDALADITPTPSEARDNTIAILPGSRRQEIKDNLGKMITAASTFTDYKLVIAGAPSIEEEYYHRYIPHGINPEIRFGKTYDIVRQSTAALVTSGTATLETALLRTPQVVCYYAPCGKIVNWLKSTLLKVPYISLVNLIAGEEVVPELIADKMNVGNIRRHLAQILPGNSQRQVMLDGYERMATILGPSGASQRAAKQMVASLRSE